MYTVTIQTVEHLSGTVVYKGHSTTDSLTPPSYSSLRCAGPIHEAIDILTGEMTLSNVSFEFMDETGHFWRDFLYADTAEISMEITIGATTEMLFWGKVLKESIDFDEYDHSTMQRRGTFDCVAKIVELKDVDPQTVFDACAVDMIALSTWLQRRGAAAPLGVQTATVARIMNVKRFFERIMEQLNGSYDDDDVVTTGYAQDCRWLYNSNVYDWMDLYFWCGTQNASLLSHGWFQEEEWRSHYGNAFDMMAGVVKGLLALPVYYYDYENSRHRVRILTRGHSCSGTTALTMGKILSSSMNPDISRDLKVIHTYSGWSNAATLNEVGSNYLHCEADIVTTEAPSGGADVELEMHFLGNFNDGTPGIPYGDATDTGDASHATIERLYLWLSGTEAFGMDDYAPWNYETQDWYFSGENTWFALPGAAKTLRSRFNPKRRSYTRKYEGLGPASGLIGDLHLMKNHDIVDEDSVTRHFYASEISRDIEADTVEVKWEEI